MDEIKDKVKVLHMAPLSTGGISKLTVDINKTIDTEKIRFDYLVFKNRKEFLEDEVLELGSKKQIVDMEKIKNPVKRFFFKMSEMEKIMKSEKYDFVHVDASTPYDVTVAIAAKKAGVKKIIMHSHNDSCKKGNFLRDISLPICRQLMLNCCTDYFAISESAARFMFPQKILESKNYTIIRNAIDASKYVFDSEKRNKIRNELGYTNDNLVIGNVGRFVHQKNHDFMIDVFEELYKQNNKARLLLVGEGGLLDSIKEKVKEKGLSDVVNFYGVTHDIPGVLSAMDEFIFPSRFEGLGIVAIEAQAAGLPVICAETITDEAKVSSLFHKVTGWNKDDWCREIIKYKSVARKDMTECVKKAGYDLINMANKMERFYLQ